MKKLMIAAFAAAMVGGAYADACSETPETGSCRAWDVKMSLKTLTPKKANCTVKADSACEEDTKETVYFLDNATRKVKGYLWVCDYTCGAAANVVLWDEKNKVALYTLSYEAIDMDQLMVYGKKATKVIGTLEFDGADFAGNNAMSIVASGVNGKMVRGSNDDDCYVKSLSGYAAGSMTYIKPASRTITSKPGTLCEDPEDIIVCDEYNAKILALCEACCFEGWCDADDADDMLPATGTWSIKYNKKVSKGKTPIAKLAPAYAL